MTDLTNINQLIESNNNKLLVAIDGLIEKKVDSLKHKLEDTNASSLAEIKKLKFEDNYKFKKLANEDQFKFNARVLSDVSDASSSLECGKVQQAHDTLEKGIEFIKSRQKLILLADKSDFGWKAVNEYKRDELMENSEDDNKWRRAEGRVERQEKAKRRKPTQKYRRDPPVQNYARAESAASQDVNRMRCFGCGGFGHRRAHCPMLSGPSQGGFKNNQISDYSIDRLSKKPDVSSGLHVNDCLEHDDGSVILKPVLIGRLKSKLEFWKTITDCPEIINLVENGYVIPFLSTPPASFTKNNRSSLDNGEFVLKSINDLLEVGSITECTDPPTVVNPLTVSTNAEGKQRLILDLRYVNLYVYKHKFRLEDLSTAKDMLHPGDHLFKFDLKSGYHHVMISEFDRQFLGFSWIIDGEVKYFTFSVLAFGLSSAPFIFTKVLRPLVAKWRREGKRILLYLDDGLCMCDSMAQGVEHARAVRDDLLAAGFLPNEEKSEWLPKTSITWLGCVVDTTKQMFFITENRISKLKADIRSINDYVVTLPVKRLASIAGQVISMTLGVGLITRLMTRDMYACIVFSSSWFSDVVIDEGVRKELTFWLSNVDNLNGHSYAPVYVFHDVIYSDASETGYGGFSVRNKDQVTFGSWDAEDCCKSSTWRELKALYMVLLTFLPSLQDCHVNWKTDNQAVVSIVQAGSRRPLLQALALDVHELCSQRHVTLVIDWVPREDNTRADELSRVVDLDDWYISLGLFNMLNARWGPHSVDRFATWYNAHLPRFNSLTHVPGTEAVDAFSQSWKGENNWVLPPPKCVCKCVNKIIQEGCQATLVVPVWESAPYWPLVMNDLYPFVSDWLDLPTDNFSFLRGHAYNTVFGGKFLSFRMLAMRIAERC